MKQLLLLFVFLFTVFFTYTVVAQEFRSIKKDYVVSIPEKIQNPVLDPLPAGTYSVGTGGYFATIQAAFDKLSTDGIAGEVILELTDNLYTAPATQFGFVLNGPVAGAGPTSRVTIKPAENKNVVIEGNGQDVLAAINTSYVTIDGVGLTGPSTLTVHALYNNQFGWNAGIEFIDNSDHNIFRNITFISDDIDRGGGGPGLYTRMGINAVADSNLFENNFIKKCGVGGIYLAFDNATLRGMGNIIRGNFLGSETDSLLGWGIQVEHAQNTIIENNIIQNLKHTPTNVSNVINVGINSYSGLGDIIRNNIVHGVKSSSGYTATGIMLSGGSGSNNMVYNNMVYDIHSASTDGNSRVAGIQLWLQDNPKIYYNSVYLSGEDSHSQPSAAFYIYGLWGTSTNVHIKNNIFVNTRDDSPYCASAMCLLVSSITTFISDNNDLHYQTNQYNCLVRILGTDYYTLADWQATGKDFHSMSLMPCFCSPALHIDCTVATCLESRGTPITGLDIDIDGDLRHDYLPDIGADEFAGLIPTGAVSAGAYSVGTNGFFPSVQTIFNRLETDGVAGNVTLELIDELYTAPTDSFGLKLNGPIPGAGPNSRVTIKPASNKNVTIEGNGLAVLSFINTSCLTFDGVSLTGSTTLTVHALENYQYGWNNGLLFMDNSDHNVIQNVIFVDEDILRTSVGLGVYTQSNTPVTPDSNYIFNNFIKKAGIGIYVSSYSSSARATGNIISGNIIGSETDSLINWGIQIEKNHNTTIENNIIQNIRGSSFAFDFAFGINSYWGSGCIIRNNIIHNINTDYTGGSTGILLSGGGGHEGYDNLIYNNMIFDINSSSMGWDSRVAGIQMWNQHNTKVYYNSVYLSGTGENKFGSAALYLSTAGSVTNLDVRNNIFINTRDEYTYGASAIHLDDITAINISSDYNDLYYDNSNQYNCLVSIFNNEYLILSDWQATGNDLHSYVEMPHFISSTDLHIDETIATYLESRGTPLAGIENDFDGDTRHASTPDIGADEFDGIVGVEDEESVPTEFALEQNYPNPFNPSTTFRYSIPTQSKVVIKIYDILGNEIATLMDEEKSVGTYELMWNAQNLSSGIYFYQLKAGEFTQTRKMLLLK
ncbi:MAG: right-handed parallel beta-helix repeat-containing protein [bacterium]|nr:right-handed parallel beta-helix repeat-containing protein [bacterium]